ncbi:Polar-differentiation response regulator DivK [Usitatibacter rugosus]|uniref:Polar-differentiation response regulator DivK n=1 Tax=Usitatibacter rugosus TaxID=2732067 RepID=A0A6M4GUF9_9PROT|nr:response regulator [Usitatibacter rugosus]QJR10672.1 Polar-differentiation response regulator DivK [Usitatibacter rugosus]
MGRRLLLVEDDERSRRLLVDVLGYYGFEVVSVGSGEEAIEVARRSLPDAALLDIQLPGISGFEVLAALRSMQGTDRLPILAVTASVMHEERARILEAGFDAYVPKPVNIRELTELLQRLLPESGPHDRG